MSNSIQGVKKHLTSIDVYTDGSFRKTRSGPVSGYGVYFPNKELKNVAAPMRDTVITNNRAELWAIYQAIVRVVKKFTFDQINIYTDSEYCQKSLTIWITKWRQIKWKNAKNQPVENQDLIKKIDKHMQRYQNKILIQWIRAHTGRKDAHSINNAKADELANKGADKYKELIVHS